MRRVLVDLNVLLDVLLDRAPHAADAGALWSAIGNKRLEGLVAAHGFTTIFYLVAKERGRAAAWRVISDLLSIFGVAAVDDSVVRRAATLRLADFEDSVSAAAAESTRCDAIVARDAAGFRGAPVVAIEPALALAALSEEVQEPASHYDGSQPRPKRGRRAPRPTRRSSVAVTRRG